MNPMGQLERASYARPREMTSLCSGGARGVSRAYLQQVDQGRDMPDVAEVMDHLQARFDLPVTQLRIRYQRAVFGIDVGPVNPQYACSFRRVDGVREGPAVLRPNGH